ncbi:hypothetical protein QGN29_08295 [Temperatibacter marinus]|uniref:Uncharacterized protein n=1 Tax=Temperatibacter marinus TaxID=1456591 RepID=A0AA52ED89_9PROT|nr:hypothetical protein [Temperatibacter marinus]WND01558.1 hypothetical protein QGN29_08295 [Temperatibacter marinus]
MNKISLFITASLVSFSSATAQETSARKQPLNKAHQMNPAVEACLENLSQNCALTAAVQTVSEESQAMERAKVLHGVAQSMIDIGQIDRAKLVLTMAEEAARSTQLSIAVQVALKEAIPLHVALENFDYAESLLSDFTDSSIKDTLLTDIVTGKATAGISFEGLTEYREKFSNARRFFWIKLKLLQEYTIPVPAEGLSDLKAEVLSVSGSVSSYRARAALASILWKNQKQEEAQVIFDQLDQEFLTYSGEAVKARLAAAKLTAMYHAGISGQPLDTMFDFTKRQGHAINSMTEKGYFAEQLGPIEMILGEGASAVFRATYFDQLMDQIEYVHKLAKLSTTSNYAINQTIQSLLVAVNKVEDSYERDVYRMRLIQSARSLSDKDLMIMILKQLEDDDNQAKGLALMAPLL